MKKIILTPLLSILLLGTLQFSGLAQAKERQETSYERVVRTGVLRCAYINWKPYSSVDPNHPEIPPKGTSTEIIEAAAEKLGLKVEYVEEIGWGTIGEGFRTNRYDAVCTQMWPDGPKMLNFSLSIPIFYSSIQLYGTNDLDRFKTVADINSPNTTIAVIDGSISDRLVTNKYPKSKILRLSPDVSSAEYYMNVMTKKADLLVGDTDEIFMQNQSAPIAMKAIGNAGKITSLPHVFAFPMDDLRLSTVMNEALRQLQITGTPYKVGQKHHLQAEPAGQQPE